MTQNRNVPFKSDFSPDELVQLLTLFEWDATNNLWWRHHEGKLKFFVECNDVFGWGCADCEEIKPTDLELLEQTFDETLTADEDFGDIYFGILWVARKRNMRPQGAWLNIVAQPIKDLFLQAGPERITDLMNPEDITQ